MPFLVPVPQVEDPRPSSAAELGPQPPPSDEDLAVVSAVHKDRREFLDRLCAKYESHAQDDDSDDDADGSLVVSDGEEWDVGRHRSGLLSYSSKSYRSYLKSKGLEEETATMLTEGAAEDEENLIDFYGDDDSDEEASEAVIEDAVPSGNDTARPDYPYRSAARGKKRKGWSVDGGDNDQLAVDLLVCSECGQETCLPDVYWADKAAAFTCNDCFKRNSNHSDCTAFECEVCQAVGEEIRCRLIVEKNFLDGTLRLVEEVDPFEPETGVGVDLPGLSSNMVPSPMKKPKKFILGSSRAQK